MQFQIMQLPAMIENEEYIRSNGNRTINGAFSSLLITRLMNFGQEFLISDDFVMPPCSNDTAADMFQVLV